MLYLLEQEVIWGCSASRAVINLSLFPIDDKSRFNAKMGKGSTGVYCLANLENFKFFSKVYDNLSEYKEGILGSKFVRLRTPGDYLLAEIHTYDSINADGKKIL